MPELEDMRQMIAEAREVYFTAVRQVLADAAANSETFGKAIGEISPHQALDALQRHVNARFAEQRRQMALKRSSQ
jgi:hypothetical protein